MSKAKVWYRSAVGPYIPRLVDSRLKRMMGELPAVMVVGPRACGKTTTAARVVTTEVRLDREADAAPFRADSDALLRVLEAPALIDEWQLVPAVLGALKRAIDLDSSPGRFVLTGSVRSDLLDASWAATGRIVRLQQWGLSQREVEGDIQAPSFFDQLRGNADALLATRGTNDLAGYVDLALAGGFPEMMRLSVEGRNDWLQSYVDQLILRDAHAVGATRDPARLRRFLSGYAANTAGIPTDKLLHDTAGVTRATGIAYENVLEMLFVTERIPAWHSNRVKRLVKSPKRVLVEPAMVSALLGANATAALRDGTLLGRLIETFAIAQLRPESSAAVNPVQLHHLRLDNGKREIDLIAEYRDGMVAAIEVKASAAPTTADASHIEWLAEQLGDKFLVGVVFHTGPRAFRLSPNAVAIPLSGIWTDVES